MEVLTQHAVLGFPEVCRAFIAHATRDMDYQGLQEFAQTVIPLHQRWVFPDEVPEHEMGVPLTTAEVLDRHGGFNPLRDYLVLGGDYLINASVVWLLAPSFSRLTVLRYDRRSGRYLAFRLGRG